MQLLGEHPKEWREADTLAVEWYGGRAGAPAVVVSLILLLHVENAMLEEAKVPHFASAFATFTGLSYAMTGALELVGAPAFDTMRQREYTHDVHLRAYTCVKT